jgi:transposase-like protein
MRQPGIPVINTDKAPSPGQGVSSLKAGESALQTVEHRQVKYLNNIPWKATMVG